MASIEKTENVNSVILITFVMNSTLYSNVIPLLIYGKLSYHPTVKNHPNHIKFKNIMSNTSCNISNKLAKYSLDYIYICPLLSVVTLFTFFHVYYTVTYTFTFSHVVASCLKHGSAAICAVLMSRTRCCHGKIKTNVIVYIISLNISCCSFIT